MKRTKESQSGVVHVVWKGEHHALRIVDGKTKRELSVSNQAFRTLCRTILAVTAALIVWVSPAIETWQPGATVGHFLVKLRGSIPYPLGTNGKEYSALFSAVPTTPTISNRADGQDTDVRRIVTEQQRPV